jgi:chromosome segregation ATPase
MKFYDSILSGLRQFFGKPEATEAEIDNILSEQKHTLPEILSSAGVDALTAQVAEMTERLNGFQSNLDALTQQLADRDTTIQSMTEQITASQDMINTRDESIAELTAQLEASTDINQSLANTNKSYDVQVRSLSATIATLKAGAGAIKQDEIPVAALKEVEQTEKAVPLTNARLAGFLNLPKTATN